MSLNPELVFVIADGVPFGGWEKVQISASMRQECREFMLQTTERSTPFISEFNFPPGTPIQIVANGDIVIDGYVNRYRPKGNATSHSVTIQGRSVAQDIVDCSAIHTPAYWENKTPEEIGKELDKFGVGISAKVKLRKIPYHQLYQGETVRQTLERSLRDQKATMMGAERGIEITNATAAGRHTGGLFHGHNIKEYDGCLSDDRQFSETVVKGQRREGTEDEDLQIEEKATNSQVRRYRPRLIVQETDSNKERARERAEHESNRSAGFSTAATLTTQGWRDDGGKIWRPNNLVYVQSPPLKIFGDMLIEAITLKQDGLTGGSIADIHVVNAKAYEGKGGANQSSGAWGG